MTETCPVELKKRPGERCGKPIKRNGMCRMHARSADKAVFRRLEGQDRRLKLRRQQKQLELLNVKCQVAGFQIVLTDPEALIERLRITQMQIDEREMSNG